MNIASSSGVSQFTIASNGSTTIADLATTTGNSLVLATNTGSLFADNIPSGTNCLEDVGGIIGIVGSGNCATLGGTNAFTGLNSFAATTTLASTTITAYGYTGNLSAEQSVFKFGNVASTTVITFSNNSYGAATSTAELISPPFPMTINSIACSLDSSTGTVDFLVGTGAASTSPIVVTTSVVTSVPSLAISKNSKLYWQAGSAANNPSGLTCSVFGTPN